MDYYEKGIIEKLKEEYNLSRNISINLKQMRNDVLINYSKEYGQEIYYIFRQEDENIFVLYKCNANGELSKVEVIKEELPEGSKIDSVLKYENNIFILDSEAQKIILEKIKDGADKIINAPNYKEEGARYYVVEGKNDTVYLNKIGTEIIFAENDIDEEIKSTLSAGFILKYENGKYVLDLRNIN